MKTAEKALIVLAVAAAAGGAYYFYTRRTGEDNPDVATGLGSIYNKVLQVAAFKVGEGVQGWTIYVPEWAITHPEWNTLTTLYKGREYKIQVSTTCVLLYGKNSYGLAEGWNTINWMGY